MRRIASSLKNPYLWATWVVLAVSLMVVGWARSYPVSYSPVEVPVLSSVSPLFWIGLGFAIAGTAGFVLTSRSKYAHWLASCLFVLFLTAPHFLYLSWGSDAGALSEFAGYIRSVGNLDIQRDFAVDTYFQWPLSIAFYAFLADALGVGEYVVVQIGFAFVAICVGGGLFAMWLDGLPERPASSRALFWGIVVYFAGFYWVLNWQAVPYTFFLALFFPMLALLGKGTWQHKVLILLLFAAGIEAHALFGVWSVLIVGLMLVFDALGKRRVPTVSLVVLLVVAQVSVIIYKNVAFFRWALFNLQGYYETLFNMQRVDTVMAWHAQSALGPSAPDLVSAILKALSWIDLGVILVALAIATGATAWRRNLGTREGSFLAAGLIHLLLGLVTRAAALGLRPVQLIAEVPAYCVVENTGRGDRIGKVVLVLSLVGLLLFPAAIIRRHQGSKDYVRPSSLLLANTMSATIEREQLWNTWILGEHNLPLRTSLWDDFLSTRILQYRWGLPETEELLVWLCSSEVLVIDTLQFRTEWSQIVGYSPDTVQISLSDSSIVYHSGMVFLRPLHASNLLGFCDNSR